MNPGVLKAEEIALPGVMMASHEGTKTRRNNWETIPLRYVCQLNPSVDFSEFEEDDELTFLPMDRVKSGYFLPNTDKFSTYASSYNAFEEGDIVLAKVTPCFENGNIAVAQNLEAGMGFGSSELFVIRPKTVNRKFLFYYFQSSAFKQEGEASMTGAGGLKRVSPDLLRQHHLPCPDGETQRLIADYLDRETACIDALVAEKEKMLALLEEKRAALISRAVTRGLDPTAPLKPSGLDWLGDIPAHWEIRRLKFVSDSLDQGSSPVAANSPAGPDELGILKLSAVNKGRFRRDENKALREIDDQEQVLSLRKGDVLITRGNTPDLVADVACVPSDEPNLLLPDLIYRLRVREDQVLPEFLTYFLTTGVARVQIQRDARGSSGSMVKVSQGHVLDWQAPIPPIVEQIEIIGKIQAAEIKSVSLLNNLVVSISLLHERRAALITAAVTGQIPVEEKHP
jgi:type I restriction enzyme S subunit